MRFLIVLWRLYRLAVDERNDLRAENKWLREDLESVTRLLATYENGGVA